MRSGDRSPPAASSPLGSSSADSRGGNGLSVRSQVIMVLARATAWRNDSPGPRIDLLAHDHRLAHAAGASEIRVPRAPGDWNAKKQRRMPYTASTAPHRL